MNSIILSFLKKNWLLLTIVSVVIIVILMVGQKDVENIENDHTSMISIDMQEENEPESIPTSSTVMVDVKGEVKNPGVYEIDKDSRIHDVINMAGGFSKNADELPVNLAQKVYDELVIYIPKKGQDSDVESIQNKDGALRINYATQDEIEKLPGIGPSKAAAILQYREDHGHFKNIEDLLEISGIGEKTLDNMREDIQIP